MAGSAAAYNSRTAVTLFMPWIMLREINDSVDAGKQVHASPTVTNVPTIVFVEHPRTGR